MTDDADLMGTSEVAALLGISRQRVLVIARQPDFPKPLAVLKMGNVWLRADIRRWTQRALPHEAVDESDPENKLP